MTQKFRSLRMVLSIALLIGYAGVVLAQDQEPPPPQTQPKPAGRGIPGIDDNSVEGTGQQDNAPWNPDTMPLTGLQSPTIGNPESRHSYWVPGFQIGSTIQNQPMGGAASSWYSNNYFGANLSVLQQWSRSQFALNYSGGGFVTTEKGQNDGWYQQMAFAQAFQWQRWQMQILDQFSYLPESQFGFGGGTGLSLPGIAGSLGPSVPGIGSSVVANQSIYAAIGPQYNNTVVTQITYQTSRRGSITFGGSYGLLRFTEAGSVDTDSYVGNVGYNYQLTKSDSIGVNYRFTAFHYQGEAQAIGSHMISAYYGKKITRRLALQIYGGPQIARYRVSVGGESGKNSGSGGASLTYAFRDGSISSSYFHGVSSGSGVLIGSNIDQVTFLGNRRLTRLWGVHGSVGFARNTPLSSQTGVQGNAYDSIYVGGGVSRPIGRETNFTAAYTAQILTSNATVCSGTGCNTSTTWHVVNLSLQWHTRPFVLR